MPNKTNEWKQVGIHRIQLTDAEQAQADASRIKSPEKQAQEGLEAALASIYAPVEYQGQLYPADPQSMAKYELALQSKKRGKARKGVAISVDGKPLKLSSATAIENFHSAIEDAVVARLAAVHDAV